MVAWPGVAIGRLPVYRLSPISQGSCVYSPRDSLAQEVRLYCEVAACCLRGRLGNWRASWAEPLAQMCGRIGCRQPSVRIVRRVHRHRSTMLSWQPSCSRGVRPARCSIASSPMGAAASQGEPWLVGSPAGFLRAGANTVSLACGPLHFHAPPLGTLVRFPLVLGALAWRSSFAGLLQRLASWSGVPTPAAWAEVLGALAPPPAASSDPGPVEVCRRYRRHDEPALPPLRRPHPHFGRPGRSAPGPVPERPEARRSPLGRARACAALGASGSGYAWAAIGGGSRGSGALILCIVPRACDAKGESDWL